MCFLQYLIYDNVGYILHIQKSNMATGWESWGRCYVFNICWFLQPNAGLNMEGRWGCVCVGGVGVRSGGVPGTRECVCACVCVWMRWGWNIGNGMRFDG